ncbi:hypothetical protein PHLGIDRAFT_100801 [Phlebiopsis gigantea 11061_1 CR5-6]|uniref:Survival motor neuron interacting protein 1 n=1 Tax=Phlebiopsis gigantea (strain 11061_1 CR5-6) TaxID=745531 RepID=A0A0C3NZ07_PHLG1|nr:hypothetical protein PHLGIDRAFT_100801 [Phlebiopsis gigantea 11061_1 CR5-6]
MSSKRKRNDVDSSDEEEPSLGKQVLPVANLPANFSGDPEDGLQYLFLVRRDARTLPHVTRAENPYEFPEPQLPDLGGDAPRDVHSALPSEDWREVFVSRFRNLRKNILQPTIHTDTPSTTPGGKLTPDMKERDHWWAFLTGRPESEWNPPKKPKKQKNLREPRYDSFGDSYGGGMRSFRTQYEVQYNDATPDLSYSVGTATDEMSVAPRPGQSLPTPSSTPAPSERTLLTDQNGASNGASSSTNDPAKIVQPEPTPRLLKQFDHRYSLHLLMYFAHWISLSLEKPYPRESAITETHGRWMFALLSRVDDYLSADEMSTLRSLARGCMDLIKHRLQPRIDGAAPDVEADVSDVRITEASCWLVISAIIGLWGQRDLWQDAEAMLADVDISSVASTPS